MKADGRRVSSVARVITTKTIAKSFKPVEWRASRSLANAGGAPLWPPEGSEPPARPSPAAAIVARGALSGGGGETVRGPRRRLRVGRSGPKSTVLFPPGLRTFCGSCGGAEASRSAAGAGHHLPRAALASPQESWRRLVLQGCGPTLHIPPPSRTKRWVPDFLWYPATHAPTHAGCWCLHAHDAR